MFGFAQSSSPTSLQNRLLRPNVITVYQMFNEYLICIGLEVATEVQSTSAEKEDGQGALGDCFVGSQALDVYPSLPHCCVVGAGAFASGVGH